MSRCAATFALVLGGAALLWGCSAKEPHAALPTAPVTPLPAVTSATMVARINGSAWGPSGCFASQDSGGPLGSSTAIDAWATDYLVSLVIPRALSAGNTYALGASLQGLAIIAGVGQGMQVSGTGAGRTGSVTITHVDADHITGTFHFDAGGDAGSFHITEGSFDAEIMSDTLAAVRAAALLPARRGAR